MLDVLANVVGWGGTIAVLFAYFGVTKKWMKPEEATFQLLNFFGAIGLLVNAWYYGALPAVGLNVVWAAIGAAWMISRTRHD